MPDGFIGRSMVRREDERFLLGRGRYANDIVPKDVLHLHVVRSPHAHAALRRIETAEAAAMAGVRGVYVGSDLAADGLGPMPCVAAIATVKPLIVPPRWAVAIERVHHVGEPVAFVVAETANAARDAAEAVLVDYQALPAIVDGARAVAGGAPQIWPQAPGNLAFQAQKGDRAAVEQAMAGAAHVIETALLNNRVVVAPIEPRAGIATYDAPADSFSLEFTGQGMHGIRRQLAEHIFKMPAERIRLSAPDVGGGFGMKNFLYPEWIMLLWAARKLGRQVAWCADRGEDFVGAIQGRDVRSRTRLALDRDGRFLALDVALLADLGAYASSFGPAISANSASTAMGGGYAIPAIFMDVRGAFTNATPVDAYRGAGKPEANYLIERTIDAAARALAIDPFELRRRNLITAFPYRTALGQTIDGGRFAANLAEARKLADLAGFVQRRRDSEMRGCLRGLGIACFLETSRGTPTEGAEIRFEPDGRIAVIVGTESNGQGHETAYAQIAADRFGLPVETFRYVQADTGEVRTGNGHGGARSMHMGGGAVMCAIDEVLGKARKLAAHLLQASPDELQFAEGQFSVRGSARSISIQALAQNARDVRDLPEGMSPGLDTHAMNMSDIITFPNGSHVAEVEIDRDTGQVAVARYIAVDDYGRLINPMLTEGQVQGGLAQGIGQALLERTVYDPESGQLLSASFMDYAIPRASDLPALEVHLLGEPTKVNALGVKGSGQAGCMAAPQTIMHAILDALSTLGIEHLDMPATPERVWQAIHAATHGATTER